MITKSGLAVILSKLEGFGKGDLLKEQYATDSEIAATMLWNAYMLGDIEGSIVADLGCGTGILGIGALLLNAKEVIFVDIDEKAIQIAKNSISKVKSEGYPINKAKFVIGDVSRIKGFNPEVIIQNPPFGTKIKHSDRSFLENAMNQSKIIYSLHKSETKKYLEGFAGKKGFEITNLWDFKFPIKSSYSFHRRRIHRIDVSCIRFQKLSTMK